MTSSTRGNQRPVAGSWRTDATMNATHRAAGRPVIRAHAELNRARCAGHARTRPSSISHESTTSGLDGSLTSAKPPGAQSAPAPEPTHRIRAVADVWISSGVIIRIVPLAGPRVDPGGQPGALSTCRRDNTKGRRRCGNVARPRVSRSRLTRHRRCDLFLTEKRMSVIVQDMRQTEQADPGSGDAGFGNAGFGTAS